SAQSGTARRGIADSARVEQSPRALEPRRSDMPRFARRAWILAALALAACGPSTFEGTVRGITLDVQSSAFTVARGSTGEIDLMVLYLSDQPDLCTLMKAGDNVRNSVTLSVWLFQTDADANNVVPTSGTYVVRDSSAARHAIPELLQLDADCLVPVDAAGLTGGAAVDGYRAEAGGS